MKQVDQNLIVIRRVENHRRDSFTNIDLMSGTWTFKAIDNEQLFVETLSTASEISVQSHES